ncbi:glycosyl transferase [unidentified eubacterium SCB49]|nr:glycosyl transferase [unidentified eubacterium SCB49]
MAINDGLVTVIVTTFNRSAYLQECLVSIVNQTYKNIEVFVIDDGSTTEIAKQNKAICDTFVQCTYFFKENTGQPASRNFGITRANGAFIAFCDDDDYWALDKLEKQVQILENKKEYDVVINSIEYFQEDGTKTGNIKTHVGYNHGHIFNHLLLKNRLASIVPLLRIEIFKKVGLFNEDFIIGEDWEFWRRVSYYYQFYFIDEVLAFVRLHNSNMSLSRTGVLLERYLLYKKITKSLLDWGQDRFSKIEVDEIKRIEWFYYRRLFGNNLPGYNKKLTFLKDVFKNDFKDPFRLFILYVKYNNKL